MLKETLRKLMNLSLEEKPEGKITEVKIGNTTCSVWIMSISSTRTAISTSNSGRAEAHAVQLRKLQRYWVFRLVRFMLPVLTIRIITKQHRGGLTAPSFMEAYNGIEQEEPVQSE